ncbi:MAG: nitroreductase, partial [Rhodobacteraceae bacterium]|nr:nitroreductase [Paracoccaceae bacterium]
MLETIPPLAPCPEVMDFFLTRRSRPARSLTLPVPSRDQLVPILTAASRVPDHGKL